MVSAKQQLREFVDRLPDNVTWEDVQYHLYVRQKIERSLRTAQEQGTLSHEQVEAEMRQWISRYDGRR